MTLEEIVELHAATLDARRKSHDTAARLHQAVAQALAEGVRAVDIAAALNITRGRVYQLKDAAERKAEQ